MARWYWGGIPFEIGTVHGGCLGKICNELEWEYLLGLDVGTHGMVRLIRLDGTAVTPDLWELRAGAQWWAEVLGSARGELI